MSPKDGGGWTEKVLHSFNNNGKDGYYPRASLILDAEGNLYGTTSLGGIHGIGTAFELTSNGSGKWIEKVLHSFGDRPDEYGYQPSGLIFDTLGNLYGTTLSGGIHGFGTVFELMPNGNGGWIVSVLHSFGEGADGAQPEASLVMDTTGNLYGTTTSGGIHDCGGNNGNCGTAFELSPLEGAGWSERVLHSFDNNGSDGIYPVVSLITATGGKLYGTTPQGGIHGHGTVFEITP